MQRRQFFERAAQSGVGLSAAVWAARPARGAAENVGVALVGCGGRGRFLLRHLLALADVRVIGLADVYEKNLSAARRLVPGPRVAVKDFRHLLDRRDVDALIVATPDHWHAIPTVLACQAGKDVYVEKPLGHNIREGQAMVKAARRYDRIVQTGTQQRSAPHFQQIRQIIQSGRLGKVHYVRIWNFRNIYPRGIGRRADSAPPEGLDWDFYLGPAPKVPFNWNRFLNNFRWFWDYAGGIITDWGTHRLDSMHQVMGVDWPQTVAAAGGRFELDDGGQVPDILQVTYEYPGFVVSYEACALCAHGCGGRTAGRTYYRANSTTDRPNGLAFYGTNGALFADRLGFEIYPELKPGVTVHRRPPERITPDLFRMKPDQATGGDSTPAHLANFIDCVRSRRRPVADVLVGHRASTTAHLGNIAFKTGRKLRWDGRSEQIADDPESNRLLARQARKPWDLI